MIRRKRRLRDLLHPGRRRVRVFRPSGQVTYVTIQGAIRRG